jgi:hypothetical protein
MNKLLLIVFFLLLCLACESKEKTVLIFNEYRASINEDLAPIGTYFWDEFSGIEVQYGLTKRESRLLGKWNNMALDGGGYNYYTFFPNKFFLIKFKFENFQVIDAEKMYFNKALGTWEIIDSIVKITIYAIITEDKTRKHPYNKDVLYVERPYTVDFINIDDIDERGFTKRPINDTILSDELKKMVTIKEPNKTNNLYVRNVYTIDVIRDIGEPEKNYGYFRYFPEMARENLSGLDIVMNPELIKKYIPDWMY